MLRDNLVGLTEPMFSGAGAYPLALRTNRKQSSDDRPTCLENPRPAGAESTLTETVASPFHAEPDKTQGQLAGYQPLNQTFAIREIPLAVSAAPDSIRLAPDVGFRTWGRKFPASDGPSQYLSSAPQTGCQVLGGGFP
jgi:hypothetical protein